MKKFDSINIGDKAELTRTITQSDIEQFVKLTGDDNKLHVDKEYSGKTAYKKPIAHGMLGASFISTVIGTKLPGDGALWFAQHLEFLLPVRVDDTITVKAEVIKKNERMQVIELKTDILNQYNKKVTTGTAKVKVIETNHSVTDKKKEVIKKRVALVIGGTGGIGRAVCIQLAKDGFDIAVHYNRNESLAENIKDQITAMKKKAVTVCGDITDFGQVQKMVSQVIRKLGAITVLANCSAMSIPSIKIENIQWKTIQDHFDINVKGAFNLHKAVIEFMEKQKYGKIIHITTQAIEKPNAEWLHYITAKSALHGFTKACAFELAPKGIRVNLVSPGMTDTELIADIPEKVRLLNEAQTPLKRISQPEDVAGAISFLASEKSDFLTGETIRVNGGQIML